MFLRLVKQLAERKGVTEQLKEENQIEWVGGNEQYSAQGNGDCKY